MSDINVEAVVREKYGAIAKAVGKTGGCCGPTPCGCDDPITSNLYSDAETESLPADAVAVSLGCGNPTALITLEPGQTVLDLGYWFTASTSFANPAVPIARATTDTFTGIRPGDVPAFLVGQAIGASAATALFRWLVPAPLDV